MNVEQVCVLCSHSGSRECGCGAASSGAGETAGSWPTAGAVRPAGTAASPSSPSPCTTETGNQQSSTEEKLGEKDVRGCVYMEMRTMVTSS